MLVLLYLVRFVFGALRRNSWTVFLLDTTMLRTERRRTLVQSFKIGFKIWDAELHFVCRVGGGWPRRASVLPVQINQDDKLRYDRIVQLWIALTARAGG